MKQIIFLIACLTTALAGNAQGTITINAGTHLVMGDKFAMQGVSFINNGVVTDTAGTFVINGDVTFSGTGTTTLYNVAYASGATVHNTVVSVLHTATIAAGATATANNNLYIRPDLAPGANLVNNGSLTNDVNGIIAMASVASGTVAYTSTLCLDISGAEMQYQWQSSADSLTWRNIERANTARYEALVTATVYYRCYLTTSNTAYQQSTPGVMLKMGSPADVKLQASLTDGISILPNPNKGVFNIKGTIGATADELAAIEVTNMLGQVVYSNQAMKQNGWLDQQVQLNSVANGMYILSVRSGFESKVFHIVVEK